MLYNNTLLCTLVVIFPTLASFPIRPMRMSSFSFIRSLSDPQLCNKIQISRQLSTQLPLKTWFAFSFPLSLMTRIMNWSQDKVN